MYMYMYMYMYMCKSWILSLDAFRDIYWKCTLASKEVAKHKQEIHILS